MKVLALDTTETACSAALLLDDDVRVEYEVAPRRAGALILEQMDRLLSESGLTLGQLDGIAFGRGPGAFTGLRIAAGVAQGAAFGADLPVAPVSSLQALAQGAMRDGAARRVMAALDARMGEVYWGVYEADAGECMQTVGEECVCRPVDVPQPESGDWEGAGSGWGQYLQALRERVGAPSFVRPDLQVNAQDVAVLGATVLESGAGVAAELAVPVYLRNKVVQAP